MKVKKVLKNEGGGGAGVPSQHNFVINQQKNPHKNIKKGYKKRIFLVYLNIGCTIILIVKFLYLENKQY